MSAVGAMSQQCLYILLQQYIHPAQLILPSCPAHKGWCSNGVIVVFLFVAYSYVFFCFFLPGQLAALTGWVGVGRPRRQQLRSAGSSVVYYMRPIQVKCYNSSTLLYSGGMGDGGGITAVRYSSIRNNGQQHSLFPTTSVSTPVLVCMCESCRVHIRVPEYVSYDVAFMTCTRGTAVNMIS